MDRRDRSLRENRFPSCRRDQETPSFSSTLLDSIYRSIDQGSEDMLLYKEKLNRTGFHQEDDHEEMAKLRRACLIEKWMEKKAVTDNKVVVRRGSMPDFQQRKARSNDSRDPLWLSHSSSSSSDSSSGSGFSSSETESKPKMILRSSVLAQQQEKFNKQMIRDQKDFSKAKHENGYVNTKSKAAMKIYNDFKKSKQPLSPGGRLTSFLNSLFTTASTKKTKISTSARDQQREEMTKTRYDHPKTTCSSASSFSRSCLSKTQSSRGKLISSSSNVVAGTRSVKFCPVNIIVDEYYQLPHGQKTLHDVDIAIPSLESTKHRDIRNSMREELKLQILERNRRVEEVDARNLGKKCNKSTVYVKHEIDDDDEEDDAASYASSDLFELDSLSAIGMDEELPVYETTQYRVIPNGLIL